MSAVTNPPRQPQLRRPWGAVVLLVAALLAGCGGSHRPSATVYAVSRFEGAEVPDTAAPELALREEGGATVRLSALRGQPVVLAFLDSTCSPGCVLVAQQIRGALDDLPRPVPVVLVSVDPRADTPARVRAFLTHVGLAGRVHYLLAPASALAKAWRAYRVTTPSAGRAAFERALHVLLIDPRGEERVLYEQEQLTPEALAHDIRLLQGG